MFLAIIIALLTAGAWAAAPPDSGVANPGDAALLLYDYAAGPQSRDWSGCGNAGSNSNTVWAAGATAFNGSNALVHVGSPANLAFGFPDSFSISVWERGGIVTKKTIIRMDNGDAGLWLFDADNNQGDGRIRLQVGKRGSTIPSVSAVIPGYSADAWTHICAVRSVSDGKLYLYANGNLIGSAVDTTQAAWDTTTGQCMLGYHPVAGAEWYSGSIASVAVFHRALTAAEIADIYQRGP